MREKLKPRLDDLLENGYDFKFGDYISQSFNILGKYIGGYIGFILIYMVITMIAGSIPIIGPLINVVLGPVLLAGTFVVSHKIHKGEEPEFGNFFEGFQRFGDIAVPAALTTLIYIAAMIPFGVALFVGLDLLSATDLGMEAYMMEMIGSDFNFPFWSLLLLLPLIYLTVAYIYTFLFVWFYNAEAWEAMEASRKVVTKNWFIIFIFGIVIWIIVMLGLIGLIIGIFVTLPIAYIAMYVSFADITNLLKDQNDDADELIDHLVS